MEQTKDVVTQIRTHYDSFSKSHRRLADFILENLHEARDLVHSLLVGAQFLAVEVGNVDNTFQVIGFCQ